MTVRLLTAACLLAATAAPVSAQSLAERGTNKLLAPFKAIVAKANESTVRVLCDDKDAVLGTVVFADGYILTKASELRGVISVKFQDGTVHDATLVGVHKPTDLALIKVGLTNLKPVEFADTKKVPVGNWLAAAGPGSDPVAVGIVSVMTRALTGPDAAVANANRGFLGILLGQSDDEKGALIESAEKGGAAEKAGMKKGDVIIEVDGREVKSGENLREILDGYRPGDKVTVKVRRKGEEMEFKATLTGQVGQKSRGDIQNGMGGELSGRRTGFPMVLQTDMVVDPKNCGGPVVDLEGNVLGINIARAGRVETWILPSEIIRPLLADLKAGKYPPPAAEKGDKDKDGK